MIKTCILKCPKCPSLDSNIFNWTLWKRVWGSLGFSGWFRISSRSCLQARSPWRGCLLICQTLQSDCSSKCHKSSVLNEALTRQTHETHNLNRRTLESGASLLWWWKELLRAESLFFCSGEVVVFCESHRTACGELKTSLIENHRQV